MKNFRKNKGFTLVELMIVIAIIGILAVVLLPKIGSMKAEAKLEGVNTNMRVTEAMVSKIITDYESTDTLENLETDVITRLADVKNPLTDATLGTTYTTGAGAAGAGAFVRAVDDTANPLIITGTGNANLKGMIGVHAYATGTQVSVDLIPYDNSGNPMVKKVKKIDK